MLSKGFSIEVAEVLLVLSTSRYWWVELREKVVPDADVRSKSNATELTVCAPIHREAILRIRTLRQKARE